jgi:hypothetical protein
MNATRRSGSIAVVTSCMAHERSETTATLLHFIHTYNKRFDRTQGLLYCLPTPYHINFELGLKNTSNFNIIRSEPSNKFEILFSQPTHFLLSSKEPQSALGMIIGLIPPPRLTESTCLFTGSCRTL